jgi:hypothetical protein
MGLRDDSEAHSRLGGPWDHWAALQRPRYFPMSERNMRMTAPHSADRSVPDNVRLAIGQLREALGLIEDSPRNPDACYFAYKAIVRGIDILEGREPTP